MMKVSVTFKIGFVIRLLQ